MKLPFHGADRGVTGSSHLAECAGKKILIDCGLYQGGRKIAEENLEPFGFEPGDIDHPLLTHPHLDHCGRIPLLATLGFRGEIIATAATVELAQLVMLESAGLQEEEARYHSRRQRRRHGNHDKVTEPLYTTLDALKSLECIGRRASYDKPLEIVPGIRATFHCRGYISPGIPRIPWLLTGSAGVL